MKRHSKIITAIQEDAEEEQRTPKAGDILTEQDAFLLKNSREIIEQIFRESNRHRQRADEMAEEVKQAHADNRRKDEIISRMRAENFAIRKAAVTYLHETAGVCNRKTSQTFSSVPETLNTPQARSLMGKLIDGQILDEHWQPLNLSNAEKGILVQYLSGELNIRNQWRDFAELWDMNSETLRRAAAKALDQRKTLVFQERLKNLLRA